MEASLKKNDVVPVEITDITAEGQGVGRSGGAVIFVPGSAPGDFLSVRIIKTYPSYYIGKIEKLIKPSPNRVEPDCPVFRRCGGCAFRHISYKEELRIKERWVIDALERVGGADLSGVRVGSIISANDAGLRSRNKAQYPVRSDGERLRAGFFAPHSRDIVSLPGCDCLLQPAVYAEIAVEILSFAEERGVTAYDEASHSGLLRHIYLRSSENCAQIAVCIVINGASLPCSRELAARLRKKFPNIATLAISPNRERTNVIIGQKALPIFGEGYIEDSLLGVRLRVHINSFYQTNRSQTERLCRHIRALAEPLAGKTVLDLYCGIGAIGLTLAGEAARVIGIELSGEAVADARHNAALNGFAKAEFTQGDAALALSLHQNGALSPDLVIVDPPRKGCGPEVLEAAALMEISSFVYVSCNPATLARDIKLLLGRGFRLAAVRPIDMFPRTANVETIALLKK